MANWKLHKYYRGCVLVLVKDRLNYLSSGPDSLTESEIHTILKIITKSGSTGHMDNKQFLNFLEEVFCIAAHLDIYIPYPDELNKMELLNEIVWKLENKVFPALKYLDTPINFPIDNQSTISVKSTGVCITSHLWENEHLIITTVKTGSVIEHKIFFNGDYLPVINNALNKLIAYTIKDATSKESKRKLFEDLKAELELLERK